MFILVERFIRSTTKSTTAKSQIYKANNNTYKDENLMPISGIIKDNYVEVQAVKFSEFACAADVS